MNRPGEFPHDFDDEVETHISLLIERFVQQGMTLEEARSAARRQFGNRTALSEARHEMRTTVWLETLRQDVRYALRVLGRNKGFAAVAILTLALGIGANTAIFSVVNAAILRPLPYPDPARLVVLWGNVKRVRVERRGASYPDYLDWRTQSRSFNSMAAFDDNEFALTGVDTPERLPGEHVSAAYFSLLGIRAAAGRTFRPEEDQVPDRDAVAVLSDGVWKRQFGGDRGIIGRKIQLDGRPYTVIGVAPAGFRGLSDRADVWVPFAMSGSAEDLSQRGNRWFQVLARLRPGVALSHAQAELNGIARNLAAAYPASNEARSVEVSPLDRETFGDLQKPLLVLLAAVGLVLFIACANVTNLLLARSEARHHEVAMRRALGASRGRLIRQFLAESAVLVAFGCVAGLGLAHYGIRALLAASPIRFPSFVHPSIDVGAGAFTVLLCAAVALVLGLVPALQTGGTKFEEALKQSGVRATGGRSGSRSRDALVVAEISLSLLLLIGAGLMMRTLQRLTAIHPGYDAAHVVRLRVSLPRLEPAPDARVEVAARDIVQRISALPAVESASISTDAPLSGPDAAIFYSAEGQPVMNANIRPRAYVHRAWPSFFHTLHVPLLRGRTFSADEIHTRANVAIVTANLVKRFWPGQDPIGKRIKEGDLNSQGRWFTIVGVIDELKYRGLPQNPTADPDIFAPFNERSRNFAVLARTSLDPAAMLASIRTALKQADSTILIYDEGTLPELIGNEKARPRFVGWLMAIFAVSALVLAMIGVYGVMAYSVSRRTREIGLRMALGAGQREVLGMVAGRGMRLVIAGMILGTAAAFILTPAIGSLVYGVSVTDPLTFAGAAAMLAMVAMAACLVPASRASRIDPAVALRDE